MSRIPTQRLTAVTATLTSVADEVRTYDQATAAELIAHAEALVRIILRLTAVPQLPLLTPTQSRVLAYVRKYIEAHGEAPTRKQIAAHFDYASHNAAQEHLQALERKGFLTLTGNVREIQLHNQPRISQ